MLSPETNSHTPVSANQKRLQRFRRAGTWYDIREMLTKDDLFKLEPLFRRAHAELHPTSDFDMAAVLRNADYKLSDPERMTFNGWAAYREGEPVGFFIGSLTAKFFSYDKIAISNLWYVDKAYRGSPVSFLLLKQFLQWASLRGAVQYIIDVIQQEQSDKQVKLFEKMSQKLGFRRAGAYFVREINASGMDDR